MQETLVRFLGQEIPWRRDRLPIPVFWPGEFPGLHQKVQEYNERILGNKNNYIFLWYLLTD